MYVSQPYIKKKISLLYASYFAGFLLASVRPIHKATGMIYLRSYS